ncbi:MAG: guanylate kinase [Spirochaetia bacterium]|nr:guanylate kinase [Spirochaetia bacterium]
MDKAGHVVVISSVSGGGKTSLIQMLTRLYPDLRTVITATSRKMRDGERNGVHYFFLTPEVFEERISRGEFLEHAFVHGNHYGVPLDQVVGQIKEGKTVILNIDVQGMRRVKELMPDQVLTIFLLPPDLQEWERRLRGRGTDAEEVIQARLKEGQRELESSREYDYRIVNDVLERAAGEVSSLLKEKNIL